jgi:electron transfer flavoprotein beta subunit
VTPAIAVCVKLVDRRPEVDPVTGVVHDDPRFAGPSDADLAAIEWALCAAEQWGGSVTAVTVGPPEADAVLRVALGVGAARAVRVDLTLEAPSELVAAALAPVIAGADLVWCGDASLDRGSGSVPAFLAARLGAAQALGLIAIELLGGERGRDDAASVMAIRRLDGGRRERLHATAPAVLSVEGSTARLRRASVGSSLGARKAEIELVAGPAFVEPASRATRPFRPRPRVLPPPQGDDALARIRALTSADGAAAASQPVELSPAEASNRILGALTEWGYLDAAAGLTGQSDSTGP